MLYFQQAARMESQSVKFHNRVAAGSQVNLQCVMDVTSNTSAIFRFVVCFICSKNKVQFSCWAKFDLHKQIV